MSRVSRLRKAVRDRTKRTRELAALLRKEERAGRWRQKRTEELRKQAERAKKTPTKTDDAVIGRFRRSRTLLRTQRRKLRGIRGLVQRSRAKLAMWRRDYRKATTKGDPGVRALKVAAGFVGKRETGYNDAPWLRAMERVLVKAGYALSWMIPKNPYCGLGVLYCCFKVGIRLPAGMVYTPNIPSYAGKNFDGWKLVRVPASRARPGAVCCWHWGSGIIKHTCFAKGPARGGYISTREFNTSPGNAGSQANGDGCWDRSRNVALLHSVYNWERA